MSIELPSTAVLCVVKWSALEALTKQAYAMAQRGELTPEAFNRLRAQAAVAVDGHEELLQTLDMLRPA